MVKPNTKRGVGRPRGEQTEKVTVSLPAKYLRELDRRAEANIRPRSSEAKKLLIRALREEALDEAA
jgi:metal-responsive CopG/Arc/MetJ family transcriptional regulator